MDQLPSTDELFPEAPKSVDDLFPADVERDRYRRQTLGTSPIQDLIFGDTSVNPIARVLDHFGQGAKQGWGSDPVGLSDESAEALKKIGIFNDYDKGQKSIIKAMNESLFRGAAVAVVDPIMRGLPAAFRGTQEAIAQVGEEVGQPQLGREAAGALEAFPTGVRAPTGIPHPPSAYLQSEVARGTMDRIYVGRSARDRVMATDAAESRVRADEAETNAVMTEIERARDLGVIGAGEGGWKGTAEVPAPTIKEQAAAGKPEVLESGMHQPVEAAPGEVKPAVAPEAPVESAPAEVPRAEPVEAAGAPVDETHPIAQDVSQRLVAAGRPTDEASAAGQVVASHYEARAARFEGALGTADELYKREGADVKGAARSFELAQKPGELSQTATRQHGLPESAGEVLASYSNDQVIKARPDYKAAKSGDNDAAIKLVEGSVNPATIEQAKARFGTDAIYAPVIAEEATGHNAIPVHLAEFYATHAGGTTTLAEGRPIYQKNRAFHTGARPMERIANSAHFAGDVVPGGKYVIVDDVSVMGSTIAAMADHIQRNGGDVAGVVTLANASRTGILRPPKAHVADIERRYGHDVRDIFGIEPAALTADEAAYIRNFRDADALRSAVATSEGKRVERLRAKGLDEGLSGEFDQVKRGKIRIREDAKPVITLFKDANESTFIHETGHQWLEELMRDAQHPRAPDGLLADSKAVLDWLGVEKASDIKTRHHEQFARGFERYMMEGKAPTQGLARVFAAFKNWLTKIYQTVDRLKSPVNDEIRGVFDRLIALKPEQVKIEPEAPKNFADIHEADALHTAPEAAHPVAETIQAERDRLANEVIPEEHDARLEGVASETRRREAGGPQPFRDGNETPRPEEAGNDQASGAVGEGGSAATAESVGPSASPRTEVPVSPQEPFKTESPLVDKAGNIRLDNLSTPEDVSQVIRDAATANNEFIDARRGVVTDGQVLELADALGMDEGQLNRRKLGEAFNAEQIMAARKLLIQSATTVRDAMAKAANGTEADVMAYAEAKQRHRMIQEQVAGLTAEAGRALRAFRKLEGQQEAGQIDAFLKDATGKTLFQLQREAQLGMQLDTPAQVSKFVNDTVKPSLKDMVIEAWMSALLSGPKTHLANIMGNTISGLWRPLETLTASGIGKARNLITGSQDRVLPGEAAAELFGMVQGSREGVVAAYKAYKTGEGQTTGTRQAEQYNPRALPSATVNIFGKERQIGGEQARIPLRLLTAEDELFKSIAYRGDINRQAYAIAAKEGLPSEQMNARVAELSANPTDEMIANAKKVAEYQTFQTPLGNVGRSVQNFSNSHILAKLVVPFVRTPINLLKYAGERSPLGVFSREVRDNISGKNGAVARDTQIARITLGTMVGVAALEMASQGLITGGGPADPKQKALMRANGWQDYSVKIGDMYYRYNRLDPFSIILGTVADAWEINQASNAKDVDKQHMMSLIFGAISKNVLERASLKGPSDLIQAVTDPERYGKGYIKSLSGTVVPALSAQTAQAMDPVVREARTVIDGLKARIPGLSQTLMPKRDVWGEPMVRDGSLGPDLVSPIIESRLKNDPVNQALISANYFPGKLDRKIRGVELTDQQYDDFQRIAGRTAKVRLNAMVNVIGNPNVPESVRKDMIEKTIAASRESARSLIIMQSVHTENDILKKAQAAKVMSLH